MSIRRLLHHLLIHALVISLLLSSAGLAIHAQEGGPVWLPFVGSGTSAPASNLIFRTRVTVDTYAAWRDLERIDPLFLERGDDWALLLVDDAQLEALARLRFQPDGTDTIEALAAANPRLARAIPALLTQLSTAQSQLAALAVTDAGATAEEALLTAARADLRAAVDSGQHA